MLKLHNTLTGKKEIFTPINPRRITMYICGPTVYDYAHIGNARPVVVFDILFRLLRQHYGDKHVVYVRNVTDIDDKIIAAAAKESVSIQAISRKFLDIYIDDTKALGALPPTLQPKATQALSSMVTMIKRLVQKKHAYIADGHVLFDVTTLKHYGKLSKKSLEDQIAGARVEIAPYKKHPADFVLWKPSTQHQPGWASPWGRGRPGWHLECSCLVERHLGKTIDIHGGGLDLIFPHHENEIAQSECVHNGSPLARFWLHNGYLTFKGEKMSKSLGNVLSIHDLIEHYSPKEEILRLALLSGHYRQPLDFSKTILEESRKRLDSWYHLLEKKYFKQRDFLKAKKNQKPTAIATSVLSALNDDLNTPKALAVLESISKKDAEQFVRTGVFLGLFRRTPDEWFGRKALKDLKKSTIPSAKQTSSSVLTANPHQKAICDVQEVARLLEERTKARQSKDFKSADKIRKLLEDQRILLKDNPDGTTTWRRDDP